MPKQRIITMALACLITAGSAGGLGALETSSTALGATATRSTTAIAHTSTAPAAHADPAARALTGTRTISESTASAGQSDVTAKTTGQKPGQGAIRLRPVHVPLASLSPALRARFTRHGLAPATITTYEITSALPGNYCLDANDNGPTAGEDGDKVQVWSCTGNANQLWIPLQWEQNGTSLTDLVNDDYQTMCLNANDYPNGLQNGALTQLYTCSPSDNGQELWNFGNWDAYRLSLVSDAYLFLDTTNFVLATTDPIADGNVVQIGIPSTAGYAWTDQLWT
jgi:hypothetical protein